MTNIPFNRSLLKSNVQKAVRLGEVDKAIRSIKSAIELDMKNFCRRIPIIILEESFVHRDFPKLIDIIRRAQRKSYTLTKQDGELMMNMVADAATAKQRDYFFASHPLKAEMESYVGRRILKGDELELVNSLRYRAKLGGSGFDMKMFNDIADVWTYRFSKQNWSVHSLWKLFPTQHSFVYDKVPHATHEDILPVAVDFHCSSILEYLAVIPKIQKVLKESYPLLNAEFVLQDVIWKCRSGLNNKTVLDTNEPFDWFTLHTTYGGDIFLGEENRLKFQNIYKVIKPFCDNYAKAFISGQNRKQEGISPSTPLFIQDE